MRIGKELSGGIACQVFPPSFSHLLPVTLDSLTSDSFILSFPSPLRIPIVDIRHQTTDSLKSKVYGLKSVVCF